MPHQTPASGTDSVAVADQAPPAPAHSVRAIRLVGGFLDGTTLDLADGLNCIVGARGTGKTTVLELVRYALNALPTQEGRPGARRRIESLVKENLGGGRVELMVELGEGLTYRISRSAGEEPIVLTAEGEPTGSQLKSGSFFAADIYSQNEVEAIADRSSSQLDLIDSFQREPIAHVSQQIQQVRGNLATNATQIAPLQARLAELDENLGTLDDVKAKLQRMSTAQGQDGEAVDQAHQQKALRDRERRALGNTDAFLGRYGTSLQELTGRIEADTRSFFANGVGTGPNAELMEEVRQTLRDCGRKVDAALDTARHQVEQARAALAESSQVLKGQHDQQELAFRELIEQHETAKKQAGERARMERRHNELLEQQRERQQVDDQLRGLLRKREELLQRLSDLRDERFEIRRGIAGHITRSLDEAVRVDVVQAGERDAYCQQLQEALRGVGMQQNVVAQKLSAALAPARLVALVRNADAQALVDEAELNASQAQKVIETLMESDVLFDLETAELSDAPSIELRTGNQYKPSSSLSTGQKCTTILPILLLDSTKPLLVDQPEDNLDNRFIFECVVNSVRQVKQRRQLIFVTHNPNIPVLGDAEAVFVLGSDGHSAELVARGSVDTCKEHIVTLLEGGEEAFKQRQSRYAY